MMCDFHSLNRFRYIALQELQVGCSINIVAKSMLVLQLGLEALSNIQST